MARRIDFNCDLGEGCEGDAAIMPLISSANIACGAHAGDDTSMRATLRLCRQFGVAAGAHPGYADRDHFGRRELQLSMDAIADLVLAQLQGLAAMAAEEGVGLVHVKPHGALYNQAARDGDLADAIATSVRRFDPGLILVGLAGSELPRAGLRAGLRVAHEAFSDRRYLADGRLANRNLPGAVIDDVEDAIAQALGIVLDGRLTTLDGSRLELHADTLCLHGDRADAVGFAQRLHGALAASRIGIAAL